jgi:hypothetical protein
MTRIALTILSLTTMASAAMAVIVPTPGPLLGAVAGPWGLIASVVGYGAYRFYKGSK